MPAERTSATQILILSDGRPGHFNLSEGIAAAIERLGPTTTQRIDVRRGRWPGAALAAFTRSPLPPQIMLERIYGIDAESIPKADIIISAGAQTIAANIWLTRLRAVPNIFYGSLRLFSPLDFSLVLTSYAARAGRPRHALQLKPSRLDPATLPPSAQGDARTARTVTLLIGGNAGTDIFYGEDDWNRLIALVSSRPDAAPLRWMIANSPRTPAEVSDRLIALATNTSEHPIEFLDYRNSGPGTLPTLLGASDVVLCTADSSSMLSECVWAQRPTLAITPARFKLDRHERTYRDWLAKNRWCSETTIAGLTPSMALKIAAELIPIKSNPQDELAQLIRTRIGL